MRLLTETFGFDAATPTECLTEDVGPTKKYKVRGIFLQANRLNGNKRIYPKETMQQAVALYNRNMVQSGRALGELGHPEGPKINLHLVSHKITGLHEDGNDYWGEAEILDTPNGRVVKAFIDAQVKIGTSSRGLGSLKTVNGSDVVQPDYRIATAGDIVHDPSAPDAFLNGIMEGVEYSFDETTQEWIAETKKNLRVMSSREREEKTLSLFEDFMSRILKS